MPGRLSDSLSEYTSDRIPVGEDHSNGSTGPAVFCEKGPVCWLKLHSQCSISHVQWLRSISLILISLHCFLSAPTFLVLIPKMLVKHAIILSVLPRSYLPLTLHHRSFSHHRYLLRIAGDADGRCC